MKRGRLAFYGSLALMAIGITFAAATGPAQDGSVTTGEEQSGGCPAIKQCPAFRGNDTDASGDLREGSQPVPTDPGLTV